MAASLMLSLEIFLAWTCMTDALLTTEIIPRCGLSWSAISFLIHVSSGGWFYQECREAGSMLTEQKQQERNVSSSLFKVTGSEFYNAITC